MSNKKVLFIFPPWLPGSSQGPYLAPHLLSTILRSKGFTVDNIDLNLRMVKTQTTDTVFLKKIIDYTRDLPEQNIETETFLEYATSALEKELRGIRTHQLEKVAISNSIKHIYLKDTKTIKDYKERGLNTLPMILELYQRVLNEVEFDGSTVCISVAFGEQLPFALDCASHIRKKSPGTKILIGGAQISLLPQDLIDELIRFKLFNVIFTGYAEDKIAEVVEHCPEEFCTAVTTGSPATGKMLDQLPFTEFDNMNEYDLPALPVMVNKGCYWGKCTFCDYTLMGDLGGLRYISRSVDIVYEEIKSLRKKYPHQLITLISDAVPPKFYKELCQKANTENFPLRTLSYMINNKNLTEEFFIEASKAQIAKIVFGTESFSDRILGLMKKQASRQDIMNNLELVKKYDINVTVNLIPNYPTSTYEEALDSVAIVEHYKNVISSITPFKFYLSANTEMDQNPEMYDLKVDERTPYMKDTSNGYHSKNFTVKKYMTPAQEDRVYSNLRRLQVECRKNYRRRDFKKKLQEFGLSRLIVTNNFNFHHFKGHYYIVSLFEKIRIKVAEDDVDLVKQIIEEKKIPNELLIEENYGWLEEYYVASFFDFNRDEVDYLTGIN